MNASTNYYLLLGIFDPDDDLSGSSDADSQVMELIHKAIRDKQLECSRASRNPRLSIQLEGKRTLDLLQHAKAALDTQAKRERQFDEADAIVNEATTRHLNNFASKGFIAAPEINLIVKKIADETNYKPTPAAVRTFARRQHIEIRQTNAPQGGLMPVEPPKPSSLDDYEAVQPHLAVCGVDDLYSFLGGSPRTCWHKSAVELRNDAREQSEAMLHKHDTLTKARMKLFHCCMDQAFANEQAKADYDACLRYLEIMKVLAAAGEACAYTKTMESVNQVPHFIQMLRDASGTAGTLISATTAAEYLLWYCRDHDIACTPTQWRIDGNAQKTAASPSPAAAAPKVAESPRPWTQSNTTQSSGWQPSSSHQPAPTPEARPFVFMAHNGARITITDARQLVETIGKRTYETLRLLSPVQLDPTLSAWLRTLPDGDRLVSMLLNEDTPVGRYLILQRMLAPNQPIRYRGIGLDQMQGVVESCAEAGNAAERTKENEGWYLANQWLVGLLITDRVIDTYNRLINTHPAFGHNEFDRDPAIPRLTALLRQYLDVKSALRGTQWEDYSGARFRNEIEIPYGIAFGSCDGSALLDDLRKDITTFFDHFHELSYWYDDMYQPDAGMDKLINLAQRAESADTSQIGFVLALDDAIDCGGVYLYWSLWELDRAVEQHASDGAYPRPLRVFPCPHCGRTVHAGTEFCDNCGAKMHPYDDGRWFPGTGRNDPCPCGSGLKYKKCHGRNERWQRR